MSYTFHYVQQKKYPELKCWYLEISPKTSEHIETVHQALTIHLFLEAGIDPHWDKRVDDAPFLHPIVLGANYLECLIRKVMHNGLTVLVNKNGGWIPKDDSINILETKVKNCFIFPVDVPESLKSEHISISQWPNGKHYYLKSNRGRIFSPHKFDTFQEAFDAALKTGVPKENIYTKKIEDSRFAKERPSWA